MGCLNKSMKGDKMNNQELLDACIAVDKLLGDSTLALDMARALMRLEGE